MRVHSCLCPLYSLRVHSQTQRREHRRHRGRPATVAIRRPEHGLEHTTIYTQGRHGAPVGEVSPRLLYFYIC
ncbi:hypothetical protein B484DRAFT_425502 [Ochromonadaceae sp. CCMP2298]|nr:hypothetical protein B484DRAFT_425502 [Ochromonadaceae sp. CCMP2298]